MTKPGARRAALYEAAKTYRSYHPSYRVESPYPSAFMDQESVKWKRLTGLQREKNGDFAFYVGELPTHEEIMLEASIESLVAEGIRRVVSWSRVMEGCAGMDHRLSLSERYLDVLDGLDAGAEEWKVINALKEPLPAREVADRVDLPDFRVCQILWTLRVLNAIARIPTGAPDLNTTFSTLPSVKAGKSKAVAHFDGSPIAIKSNRPFLKPSSRARCCASARPRA